LAVAIACLGAASSLLGDVRRQVAGKLLIASTLPIACLAVYAAWPRFEMFYALPFLFGISLGLAVLVGELARDPRWRAALAACWLVVLAGSALIAIGQARFVRARREVNYMLALELARYPSTDTVAIAGAGLTPQSWQNPAATLVRYAVAIGATRTPPQLRDVDCAAASALAKAPRRTTRMFVYVGGCPGLESSDRTIERPYAYFDWSALSLKAAPYRVAVFAPHP